jgi:hypothetical protein
MHIYINTCISETAPRVRHMFQHRKTGFALRAEQSRRSRTRADEREISLHFPELLRLQVARAGDERAPLDFVGCSAGIAMCTEWPNKAESPARGYAPIYHPVQQGAGLLGCLRIYPYISVISTGLPCAAARGRPRRPRNSAARRHLPAWTHFRVQVSLIVSRSLL